MEARGAASKKRVADLEHGEDTAEYGTVTHREGRKVWFDSRIITFPSEDELVTVYPEET